MKPAMRKVLIVLGFTPSVYEVDCEKSL